MSLKGQKFKRYNFCKHCSESIYPCFVMDEPVIWKHTFLQTRECTLGAEYPIAEPESDPIEKEEPMDMYFTGSTADAEATPYSVQAYSFYVTKDDGKLLLELATVFGSKEYSKAHYTREELQNWFAAIGENIRDNKVGRIAITNPERFETLKVEVVQDHLGQWQVDIEGRVISPFDTEEAAQEFADAAVKNPMMWRQ